VTNNSARRLDALIAAAKAQKAAANPIRLRDSAIKAAQPLIDNPCRWKAALCTRRSAKSYTLGLYLCDVAASQKCNVLYVGIEHGQIKKDFWRPVIQEIDAKHELRLQLNESELSAKFPNGSYLYCLSMDASASEHRKLRGGKYKLIGVDEAQSFKTDLDSLIKDVLQPATADYHGTIVLIGTPGTIAEGVWYDITHDKMPAWKTFSWTAYENQYVEWAREIEELEKATPGIEKTTSFRREYLSEWVIDDSDLLYKFDPTKNLFDTGMFAVSGKVHSVLGCDLGWDHPAALVAMSYTDQDPCLYVRECVHGPKWTVTDMAEKIKLLNNRYHFERMVCDPSWAQTIGELRARHNLPIQAADKPGRDNMIELVNDAFILGLIKINPVACAPLVHELKTVNKVDRVGDDCCDAFRYGWKDCYSYRAKALPQPPVPGTQEYGRREEARMWGKLDQEIAKRERIKSGIIDFPEELP
jgi:hypothetical protein